MSNSEFNKIFRRIKEALSRANWLEQHSTDDMEKDDAEFAKDAISDLINAIFEYTRTVFLMNKNDKNRAQLFENNDRSAAIAIIEAGEKKRKSAHNNLISCIKVADVSCGLIGVEPIHGELLGELKKMYEANKGYPKDHPRHMENDKDSSILCKESNRDLDAYTDDKGKTRKVVDIRHDIANWAWDFSLDFIVGITLGMDIDSVNLETIEGNRQVSDTAERNLDRSKKILKEELRILNFS